MTRSFSLKKAVKTDVNLRILLSGASSSGKTYTALRLAKGITEIAPGDIVFIDTEEKRALHYADDFSFTHMDFGAPFGSDDYIDALIAAMEDKPSVIIVDSMSHEHEGTGGMIDYHAAEMQRLANAWGQPESKTQIPAWQKPKAARRRLLNKLVRIDAHLILCFRAGTKSKPGKKDGRSAVIDQGFTSIGGVDFVYEMDVGFLLMPGSNGIPTLSSDKPGERLSIKAPKQFANIIKNGDQLTEAHGRKLAEWACAGSMAKAVDKEALLKEGDLAADRGMEALAAFWKRLNKAEQEAIENHKDKVWKPRAQAVGTS